jgi:hypothetical protein
MRQFLLMRHFRLFQHNRPLATSTSRGTLAALNEKAGPIGARSAKQSGLDFLKSLNHIKSRLCQPRDGKAHAA